MNMYIKNHKIGYIYMIKIFILSLIHQLLYLYSVSPHNKHF